MLEITIGNCHTCNLETIDNLNSQYFWMNRRDLEIESKCNWQAIFDKCKDTKWRPNITFLLNKKFVRNDLFQKIIKNCKATNLESLKPKEKLGLCLYKSFVMNQSLFQRQKKFLKKKNSLQSMMLKINNWKKKMKN